MHIPIDNFESSSLLGRKYEKCSLLSTFESMAFNKEQVSYIYSMLIDFRSIESSRSTKKITTKAIVNT